MIRHSICIIVPLLCSILQAQPNPSVNLVTNGSLEILGDNNLPKDWRVITTWGPKGSFASDDHEHHSGQRSLRISADVSSQNYLATDGFGVSPGEVFSCSGWVKTKDVKTGENGKVQIQGVIAREDGSDDGVTIAALKLNPSGTSDWTHVEGDFKIPAQTTKAWVRFGMHDATGTTWWDDVDVRPQSVIAGRIDVTNQRISPTAGGIPITILNRDKRQSTIHINALLGKQMGALTLPLSGDAQQSAVVPMTFNQPGILDCTIALLDANNRELFKQKRKAPIPPPIAVMPPIPTHWVKEDGAPDINGEIDLAVPEAQRTGATLTMSLLDSSNKVHGSWKSADALKDGWNHWAMKTPELPLGDYKLVATLTPRSGEPIKDEQSWHVIERADSKVILNSNGYLESKGKPIYPLGIFNSGGHTQEMADSGFTITHAYNAMNVVNGEPAPDLRPQTFLDETEKAGMKCLFLVPRNFVFHGDWDNVRRRIRMFRNHPALLAWDEEEGIARGDMKLDDLKTLEKIIREEDPNHPLMIGDSRDGIRKVVDRSNFFPVQEMDLGMWWWYPLPLGGGQPSALDGEEAAKGLEMVPPSFLTERNTDKPIWIGVQAYKKPPSWARYPTSVEYRAQAYLSIIHGAKGLMWYGGGIEGGIYGNLKEGHWDDLKALVKELHEMAPVFMATTGTAPKFSPENAPISVMLKTMSDRTVLLACNRGSSAADVTFDLPKSARANVLYENRALNVTSGKLKDHFEPYVVHIYELR